MFDTSTSAYPSDKDSLVTSFRTEFTDQLFLFRVASIASVAGRRVSFKREYVIFGVLTFGNLENQVKVHYDGWPEEFQVWMDDSR